MAKVSNNPIESFNIDWTHDPANGLPFSGQAIQQYIRTNIEVIETQLTLEEIQDLLNLN